MIEQLLIPLFNSSRIATGDRRNNFSPILSTGIFKYNNAATQEMEFSMEASSAKGMVNEKFSLLYETSKVVPLLLLLIFLILTVAFLFFPQLNKHIEPLVKTAC